MRWKTILVPHDFSACANHAAALARDEAKLHGARIALLHVIELPAQLGQDAVIVPADTQVPVSVRDHIVSSASNHLVDIADRLAKDGVEVSQIVRIGHPVEEIVLAARDHGADLIVMGTHGRTGFRALIAGSVTERVVRASPVPVLTVRHTEPS